MSRDQAGSYMRHREKKEMWHAGVPAFVAAAARLWERAAILSCCSRVMPNFSATFSDVIPAQCHSDWSSTHQKRAA